MSSQYVVIDPAITPDDLPGYLCHLPLIGWGFTYLYCDAERFRTEVEARSKLRELQMRADGLRIVAVPVKEKRS